MLYFTLDHGINKDVVEQNKSERNGHGSMWIYSHLPKPKDEIEENRIFFQPFQMLRSPCLNLFPIFKCCIISFISPLLDYPRINNAFFYCQNNQEVDVNQEVVHFIFVINRSPKIQEKGIKHIGEHRC